MTNSAGLPMYCPFCLLAGVLQDPIATYKGSAVCAWHLVELAENPEGKVAQEVRVQEVVRRLQERASELADSERREYQQGGDRVQYALQQSGRL